MIILPLSHESGQVQRWPYITIGILVLNVLLYAVTAIVAPQTRRELNREAEDFFGYYMRHPYLEIPEETLDRIPPEGRQALDQLRRMEKLAGGEVFTSRPDYLSEEEIWEQQRELNRRIAEFEAALGDEFYRKYGYIPARGGVFTLISSMFLHGGFLHLLFNMLFLWLCGGNIEDLWGRIVFPIFYLTGGVAATLMHAGMFPGSHVPLVGASGAIAALMGAFMIRLYNTRIYFWYFFFFGFRMKSGTFKAPAYAMLPLWLLQQLFEAYKGAHMASGGGGVAFWAHIGGFLFGAAIALIFKFTGFEENVLAPALDRKTDLVDGNYASGSRKLQEGDLDGAVMDLRKALLKNPDHALAHGDLSMAYFQQGKDRAGMLELGRAVRLHLSRDDAESAIETYLEIADRNPPAVLEPDRQLEIARLMERSEMFDEAAGAYRRLMADLRGRKAEGDDPEKRTQFDKWFKEAQKAVGRLKGRSRTIAPKANGKDETGIAAPPEVSAPPKPTAPAIPLARRLKVIKDTGAPPRYDVKSVAPREAMKVEPMDGGLNLYRPGEAPPRFEEIYAIWVSQLAAMTSGKVFADLFLAGKSRPYRLHSQQIAYGKFLNKPTSSSFTNFRQFILHLVSQIDSVYVDKGTLSFLKTGGPAVYPNQDELSLQQKTFWRQAMGEVRRRCGNCSEIYWIDGRRVPAAGAKSKCKKCGQPLNVCRPATA
jgi:membrane associated rhomboid family serine protease